MIRFGVRGRLILGIRTLAGTFEESVASRSLFNYPMHSWMAKAHPNAGVITFRDGVGCVGMLSAAIVPWT